MDDAAALAKGQTRYRLRISQLQRNSSQSLFCSAFRYWAVFATYYTSARKRANQVQAPNFATAAKFEPVPVLQRIPLLGGICDALHQCSQKGKPGTGSEFRNCSEIRASPCFAANSVTGRYLRRTTPVLAKGQTRYRLRISQLQRNSSQSLFCGAFRYWAVFAASWGVKGATSAAPSWPRFPEEHPAPRSAAHTADARAQEGPVSNLPSASENSWAFDPLRCHRCRSWRHMAWK